MVQSVFYEVRSEVEETVGQRATSMMDCELHLQFFKGHRMQTSQLRYLESEIFSSVASIWSKIILYARILRGFLVSIHTFKIWR